MFQFLITLFNSWHRVLGISLVLPALIMVELHTRVPLGLHVGTLPDIDTANAVQAILPVAILFILWGAQGVEEATVQVLLTSMGVELGKVVLCRLG